MILGPLSSASDSLIAPTREAFAIAPNDTAEFPRATKAPYVATDGNIVLRAVESESDVVLRNVVAGSVLAIRLREVRTTGTTAANLVGLA